MMKLISFLVLGRLINTTIVHVQFLCVNPVDTERCLTFIQRRWFLESNRTTGVGTYDL